MLPVENLGDRHPMAAQIVHGEIDPTDSRVLAHVANDVGELKGQAQPIRILQCLRIGAPEDAAGHFTDHTRSPPAVQSQSLEIQVAILLQVHAHAVDDFDQSGPGDVIGAKMSMQRLRDRVLRRALIHAIDFGQPPVEFGAGHTRVACLIDHIIDFAAKRIQRSDRPASLRRQKEKTVVEARAAASGLVLAVLVRGHGVVRAVAVSRLGLGVNLSRRIVAAIAGASLRVSRGRIVKGSWSLA